jgi:hypothetical protein
MILRVWNADQRENPSAMFGSGRALVVDTAEPAVGLNH